jgi:hypothetical protein
MKVDKLPRLNNNYLANDLERFVFSAPQVTSAEDKDVRRLLESNQIFVQRTEGELDEPEFYVAVPAWSLLDWIKNIPPTDSGLTKKATPCTNAARTLLRGLNKKSPSLWWERFVAVTIVSRSLANPSLKYVFGVPLESNMVRPEGLDIKIAEKALSFHALPDAGCARDTLTIYQDNQPGFDGHVIMRVKEAAEDDVGSYAHQIQTLTMKKQNEVGGGKEGFMNHFYLQMKIQSPQKKGQNRKKTTSEVLASALSYTLLNHVLRYGESPDGNVNFILYNWGLERELPSASASPDPYDLKCALLACWDESKGGKLPSEIVTEWIDLMIEAEMVDSNFGKDEFLKKFDDLVKAYVEKYFQTNIHVVDGPMLDKWLLPSFLPFPMMLTALGIHKLDDTLSG